MRSKKEIIEALENCAPERQNALCEEDNNQASCLKCPYVASSDSTFVCRGLLVDILEYLKGLDTE